MWTEILREKLEARTARVSVIGLGYVGLSLAVELAKAGIVVRGVDLDLERVQADQKLVAQTIEAFGTQLQSTQENWQKVQAEIARPVAMVGAPEVGPPTGSRKHWTGGHAQSTAPSVAEGTS